jgi:predicted acylesterase/phospholipase RssA
MATIVEEDLCLPVAIEPRPIGVTFSGGGFRATLYHLGVVRFLYEAGLLGHVTHITGVSGGSILASHLVLNWERYTGSREEFDEAARELVTFAQWDLRGRVIRPWLFSWAALALPRLIMKKGRWGLTNLLLRGFDRLFAGARLEDLDRPGRPQLHILATSMTTGQLVSFGVREMRMNGDPNSRRPEPLGRVEAGRLPVAMAVAASSAIPPLFPPIRVTHKTFDVDEAHFPHCHYLGDGGIFDNLGIRKLLWLNREQDVRFDLVVVSDAQREFAEEYKNEYKYIWGRAGRSVDLMMERLSWFENDSIRRLCIEAGSQLLECRLQRAVGCDRPDALSDEVQSAVRNVRTDVDVFTNHEINALIHQGRAVARSVWEEERAAGRMKLGSESPAGTAWYPVPPAPPGDFQLGRSDRRSFGLFRPGHWATWAFWGLLFLYFVALPAGSMGWLIHREASARRDMAAREASARWEMAAREALAKREMAAQKARLERLQREQDVTRTNIRVIEKLVHLTLASRGDEWEHARDVWTWGRASSRGKERSSFEDPLDSSFENLLEKSDREIHRAIMRGPADPELKLITPRIAKAFRSMVEKTNTDSRYREVLESNRKDWYEEAIAVTKRIAGAPKKTLDEFVPTRKRFWRLYLGDLVLIEGPAVSSAMVGFGKLLKEWEALKEGSAAMPEELASRFREAAAAVERACKAELKSPQIDTKPPGVNGQE